MHQPIESEPPPIHKPQMEEPKKKHTLPSKESMKNFVVGGTVFGLAVYGAADVVGNAAHGIYERLHTPTRPEQPVFPLDTSGKIPQEFEIDLQNNLSRSLVAYSGWEESGRRLQKLLEKTQSPETIQALDRIGRNLLIEGTNTLQTAWLMGKIEDRVQLSSENDSLWINDERYDLKNRFEMQQGSAWLQTKLSQLKMSMSIEQATRQSGEPIMDLDGKQRKVTEYSEELSLLTWFHRKTPPVVLEEESVAFFPRNEMVKLARITQAVDALGFGLPRTTWFQGTQYENLFGSDSVGNYSELGDDIREKNSEFAYTFAHESGHWVSSRKDLLAQYRSLRGSTAQASKSERLRYVTNYAMTNEKEDFADTFRMYLMQGDYFRNLLNELKAHASAAYIPLQMKYDFMQQTVFQGREFSQDAKPRIPVQEEMEREFAGLTWSVEDHSVTISPHPDVFSGRHQIRQVFPIVVENDIQDVAIAVTLSAYRGSYSVTVDHPTLLHYAVLEPLPGDDRIQVNTISLVRNELPDEDTFKKSIEDGNNSTKVVPLDTSAAESVMLDIRSYSPIEQGQKRRVRNNEYKWSRVPLLTQSQSEDTQDIIPEGSEIEIMSGPEEVEIRGKNEKIWLVNMVNSDETYSVWLSQRWIGENIGR